MGGNTSPNLYMALELCSSKVLISIMTPMTHKVIIDTTLHVYLMDVDVHI